MTREEKISIVIDLTNRGYSKRQIINIFEADYNMKISDSTIALYRRMMK